MGSGDGDVVSDLLSNPVANQRRESAMSTTSINDGSTGAMIYEKFSRGVRCSQLAPWILSCCT
jgi:hypothetical protein